MPRTTVKTRILRFSPTAKRDPAVQAWFDGPPGHLRALARPWFERMRECGDDVRELMHDLCPTACVGDGGFGYVNSFRDHVNVGFFRGSMLKDPARLLEGTGSQFDPDVVAAFVAVLDRASPDYLAGRGHHRAAPDTVEDQLVGLAS